jgi:hypothetical protein
MIVKNVERCSRDLLGVRSRDLPTVLEETKGRSSVNIQVVCLWARLSIRDIENTKK